MACCHANYYYCGSKEVARCNVDGFCMLRLYVDTLDEDDRYRIG